MSSSILNVAITTDIPLRNMELICPDRKLAWGRCRFQINPPADSQHDYWISYAGCPASYRLRCAPENTLFVSGEPPAKKVYPRRFYGQFHDIVCASGTYPHPRVTHSSLGINWQVGFNGNEKAYTYGYDELMRLQPEPKQLKLSVVCSNLRATEGQRLRLDFLEKLKARLGDRIVHFGRGYTPVADKMDAIAPYHYHLVLENSSSDDYWTEKLADAYLGWSFPVYLGCPNLERYFPSTGFARVNPGKLEESVARIETLLQNPPAPESIAALVECRQRILNDYNPFALFSSWAERFHQSDAAPRSVTIRIHKAFRPFPAGLIFRLRNRV